jgi:hypothetical protein
VALAQLPDEVHHYVDDLDDHGSWSVDEQHGSVWYPTVSSGWAPYRDGRWGYTSYGYTWVSYEPWGWAPYHYGRWGYGAHGWYWVPGRHWGPAWVSFAVGPAWIGWSPLGYRGGAVFGYDYVYYGSGRYPHAGNRRYYRGGKAVPRHVYDHGSGWNFSGKEHFRRGGKARLRADQVRSSSARARVANQAAILDRDLTPRGIGEVGARAPRPLAFTNDATATARTPVSRARARVSPSFVDAPSSPSRGRESSASGAYRATTVSRTRARQRDAVPSGSSARSVPSEAARGFVNEQPRTGSRVFRAQGATRTESRDEVRSGSARRRATPTRTRPETTTPSQPEISRSRDPGTRAQPRSERRTRGQDYFESSTRRDSLTRPNRSPDRSQNRSTIRTRPPSSRSASPRSEPSSSVRGVAPSRSGATPRNAARPQTRSSGSSRPEGAARSSSGGERRSGATRGGGSRSGSARGRNR